MNKNPILLAVLGLSLWGSAAVAASSLPNGTIQRIECGEGFEDVDALFAEGGWLRINNSTEPTTWEQATAVGRGSRWEQKIEYLDSNKEGLFFNARAGTPHSVAFTSLYAHEVLELPDDWATGTGVLSNWLLTPEITFQPGMTLRFWTRKGFYDYAPIWAPKPDRMVIRACTGADCTDVGTGPDDVGNFTTELLAINPALGIEDDATGVLGYPYNGWREFVLSDLPTAGTGRIAFHYHVPQAMDVFGAFFGIGIGNMVALDSVTLEGADACPLQESITQIEANIFSGDFEAFIPLPEPIVLSQNTDTETVEPGLTFGCVDQTSFLRRFDLDGEFGLEGSVAIESVEFGVERAYSVVPVEVRLHSIPNEAELQYANLTPIGGADVNVQPDDRLSRLTVDTPAELPDAGTHDLVVQLRKREFHRELFFGFNAAVQTAPSYVSFESANCGSHPEPTNVENVAGAPDAALLLNVNIHAATE